jgi:hypothetical protein
MVIACFERYRHETPTDVSMRQTKVKGKEREDFIANFYSIPSKKRVSEESTSMKWDGY